MTRIRDFAALKAALRERGFRPRSSLGQNFLLSPGVLQDIVKHAEVGPEDRVVEIGVGAGSLTGFILEAGASLLGVEIERKLLGVTWQQYKYVGDRLRLLNLNVLGKGKVLSGEFRDELLKLKEQGGWKLVANLPYNISTPIFMEIMASEIRPVNIVVLVQRDFAERVCASPGGRNYSPVSVLASTFGSARIVRNVPAKLFWPVPEVESSVVKWVASSEPPKIANEKLFFRTVSLLFTARRKKIVNVLRNISKIAPEFSLGPHDEFFAFTGISPDSRAEQLPPEAFLKAAKFFDRAQV
ncbi:MAG: 16S rRNA (adenine(1518)-N(6)/adenine(1519)-N(6)) -dimethyltransferase RsmA [Planctomycetota bacterium]